ncbi:uncharacterized protein [Nicotiana sylvestris]|uniref:uncharacterized protein n=1 Tax=Nicotiana sylvestris TaxID=4096 RepID=UPI00388CB8C3
MDDEDTEKTAFITPWGVYCYKMMPFSLKNAGATYMRGMITIFHDMIHKEIEVYVDDVIIKSKRDADHIAHLRKFFDKLRRMDPLKYIFQKPMPTGKLAKWQILLSEFEFVYITQKAVKGQALADHLVENPVGGEYEPLKTYFPDEEVSFVGEDITEAYDGWKMFYDGAANFKGMGIGEILVSETGTRRVGHQEFQDIAISLPCAIIEKEVYKDRIPTCAQNSERPSYCAHVEEEVDGKPWFHDVKEYLSKGEYPEHANHTHKCTLLRLSNHFFHSGENLYRRTPDLGLLRCVDAKEASKLLEIVHAGTCGPYMNGFILDKKILRAGYFWMTMETDCIQYVHKCFQCQVHADMIEVPPNELNATSSPWPFAAWGMDVIGLIEPTASNGHRFILVTQQATAIPTGAIPLQLSKPYQT